MSFIFDNIDDLDRSASAPLYEQLYQSIRTAIKSGRLHSGDPLPSSREFAKALEISRNTVNHALDKLEVEGYIKRQDRSGTYVSDTVPEDFTRVHARAELNRTMYISDIANRSFSLSSVGQRVKEFALNPQPQPERRRAFHPGVPAFDAFPIEVWANLISRRWHSLSSEQLVYGDPAGYLPLREAISKYLRTARGVRCETDQVIVVSGIQQALMITAQTLINPDDTVCVENPGFTYMKAAFAATGATIIPVPLDNNGFNLVDVASREVPKMIGVTPSHQFPLGITMGLSRRLNLLEYAASNDVWILEDDYDSEYRYSGQPIAALQGLDNSGRVIYTGTFSKVLFPALRLGYLVAPPDLVAPLTRMRAITDRCPPRVTQMVLTDFMTEGHFLQHIRKMRTLCNTRQKVLVEAINREFDNFFEVYSTDAGLHLVAWLPEGVDDQAVSKTLYEADLIAPPLSNFYEGKVDRGALLLGYAGVDAQEIRDGVKRMAKVLSAYL